MVDPVKLGLGEKLGRRVSSSSDRRAISRGTTPVRVFFQCGRRSLSVDRLISGPHKMRANEIAANYDRGRGRTFYGWAVVTQEDASRSGRYVKPSPQPENCYHADIVLPDSDNKQMRKHAMELSANVQWCPAL